MPLDLERAVSFLRGAADILESREKRLAFKQRFGEAAARTVFEQLKRRGINPELIELIKKDLEL